MKALPALATTILVSALACLPALAQTPDMQVTAAGRQQLVDSLSREVDQRYVFPDTAKKVAASLREQQARGAYEDIASARQLAEALTQQIQATSGDRHMRVVFSDQPIPESKPAAAPPPEEASRRLDMARSSNFGV